MANPEIYLGCLSNRLQGFVRIKCELLRRTSDPAIGESYVSPTKNSFFSGVAWRMNNRELADSVCLAQDDVRSDWCELGEWGERFEEDADGTAWRGQDFLCDKNSRHLDLRNTTCNSQTS
jgi:hypothetical protein